MSLGQWSWIQVEQDNCHATQVFVPFKSSISHPFNPFNFLYKKFPFDCFLATSYHLKSCVEYDTRSLYKELLFGSIRPSSWLDYSSNIIAWMSVEFLHRFQLSITCSHLISLFTSLDILLFHLHLIIYPRVRPFSEENTLSPYTSKYALFMSFFYFSETYPSTHPLIDLIFSSLSKDLPSLHNQSSRYHWESSHWISLQIRFAVFQVQDGFQSISWCYLLLIDSTVDLLTMLDPSASGVTRQMMLDWLRINHPKSPVSDSVTKTILAVMVREKQPECLSHSLLLFSCNIVPLAYALYWWCLHTFFVECKPVFPDPHSKDRAMVLDSTMNTTGSSRVESRISTTGKKSCASNSTSFDIFWLVHHFPL